MAFNVATGGGGPAGSGEVKLYRLDDVDYNTVKMPTNGQALVWSASLGKWQANTISGGGANLYNSTLTGTTTITNLVLTNVLGVQYGGTGKTSLTQNGVMYAANSSAFAFATGTNGKVMQIGPTGVPVFDDLDGGSFP
jgi:hypothetical protein